MRRFDGGLAAALLLAACAQAVTPVPAPPTPSPQPAGGSPQAAGLPAELLEAMLGDARQRHAGVAVRLIEARVVTWRSSALGCPQPDRVYAEALVPGWHVRIEAGTHRLSYHASRRGAWLLCPPGREEPPLPDPRAM